MVLGHGFEPQLKKYLLLNYKEHIFSTIDIKQINLIQANAVNGYPLIWVPVNELLAG